MKTMFEFMLLSLMAIAVGSLWSNGSEEDSERSNGAENEDLVNHDDPNLDEAACVKDVTLVEVESGDVEKADANSSLSDNSRVVQGTAGRDVLIGGESGQLLSHRDLPGLNLDQSAHTPITYSDFLDGSADIIQAGGGDDTIIAGSGDEISTGDGSDLVELYHEPETAVTTVTDFEQGRDKLIAYVPSNNENTIGVQQEATATGVTITIVSDTSIQLIQFMGDFASLIVTEVPGMMDLEENGWHWVARQSDTLGSDIFIVRV